MLKPMGYSKADVGDTVSSSECHFEDVTKSRQHIFYI